LSSRACRIQLALLHDFSDNKLFVWKIVRAHKLAEYKVVYDATKHLFIFLRSVTKTHCKYLFDWRFEKQVCYSIFIIWASATIQLTLNRVPLGNLIFSEVNQNGSNLSNRLCWNYGLNSFVSSTCRIRWTWAKQIKYSGLYQKIVFLCAKALSSILRGWVLIDTEKITNLSVWNRFGWQLRVYYQLRVPCQWFRRKTQKKILRAWKVRAQL